MWIVCRIDYIAYDLSISERCPRTTGLLEHLAERRARYPQCSGFEPDLFSAYYMPFSCRWRLELKLRLCLRTMQRVPQTVYPDRIHAI